MTRSPVELNVWKIQLSKVEDQLDRYKTYLNQDELARANRFLFDRDRNRFVICRGAMKVLLAEQLDTSPTLIEFEYGEKGKPYLARNTIEFNLSHAKDWAYFGINDSIPLGIDLEFMRPPAHHGWIDIAKRFFAPAEFKRLSALPVDAQAEAFFCCWTQKEAYIKLHGDGLSLPLDQFTVNVDPTSPAKLLTTTWNPADLGQSRLYHLEAPHFYRASVALRSVSPINITYHQFINH